MKFILFFLFIIQIQCQILYTEDQDLNVYLKNNEFHPLDLNVDQIMYYKIVANGLKEIASDAQADQNAQFNFYDQTKLILVPICCGELDKSNTIFLQSYAPFMLNQWQYATRIIDPAKDNFQSYNQYLEYCQFDFHQHHHNRLDNLDDQAYLKPYQLQAFTECIYNIPKSQSAEITGDLDSTFKLYVQGLPHCRKKISRLEFFVHFCGNFIKGFKINGEEALQFTQDYDHAMLTYIETMYRIQQSDQKQEKINEVKELQKKIDKEQENKFETQSNQKKNNEQSEQSEQENDESNGEQNDQQIELENDVQTKIHRKQKIFRNMKKNKLNIKSKRKLMRNMKKNKKNIEFVPQIKQVKFSKYFKNHMTHFRKYQQ